MRIRETKTITIGFDTADALLIKRLIVEQVGGVTIGKIMDEMSYVFDWYLGMMTLVKKIAHGDYVTLDHNEKNAVSTILSKAYNSETETEKEAIKAIADAIDLAWNNRS